MISEALRPFLDDLENRLIPEQEEAIRAAWEDFACGRSASAPFIPPGAALSRQEFPGRR